MSATDAIDNIGHVRVHSVLYDNELERIQTTIQHLDRAVDLAVAAGVVSSVTLVYGDSSATPAFSESDLAAMRASVNAVTAVEYVHFDANLGSARGHNTLLETARTEAAGGHVTDQVLIMNPDVMLAPDALIELARPLSDPKVGMVEARQLPIEHPKEYNKSTGQTDWATTACALIPMRVFDHIGCFDSDTFFLYCDDVDFSWRARLAGYKIIYQPSAAVFHDKRLGSGGQWAPTSSERYYSAEAALMMAHKYSRPKIVERLLKEFAASSEPHLNKAVTEYVERREAGRLPTPIDAERNVSRFEGHLYTQHRFEL